MNRKCPNPFCNSKKSMKYICSKKNANTNDNDNFMILKCSKCNMEKVIKRISKEDYEKLRRIKVSYLLEEIAKEED